jgi:signal transduction histidine kinase
VSVVADTVSSGGNSIRAEVVKFSVAPKLGASTGTLDSLEAFAEPRFVADADVAARRRLQRFAAATGAAIFYLEPGRKQLFSAGSAFTTTLFAPMVAAAVDCLKSAGLTQAESVQIAERNATQTLRAWLKSGRKGWTGMLPDGDADAVRRQLNALQSFNGVIAESFVNSARLGLTLFQEDARWLDTLAAEGSPDHGEVAGPQGRRLAAAGRLAANLAHDWNNMLTLLAAQAAEIAEQFPAEHPGNGLVDALNRSIAQAADSPRRLLGWLREEPGKRVECDMNLLIQAALPLVRLALERGVQCAVALSGEPAVVQLDQPLFINALLNLASNATAAMGGHGVFSLKTEVGEKEVLLTVEDDGPGMDEETRQRVFEPFFSTRRGNGGTGLGMETVRSFVDSHGFRVAVDSAPGQGCRFTFHCPR